MILNYRNFTIRYRLRLIFEFPLFPFQSILIGGGGCADKDKPKMPVSEKRKSDEGEQMKDLKKVRHFNWISNLPNGAIPTLLQK